MVWLSGVGSESCAKLEELEDVIAHSEAILQLQSTNFLLPRTLLEMSFFAVFALLLTL